MNVFTEISTRELENTLKGKAVRYIVNDAGEGLCLFFEGSPHYSPLILSSRAARRASVSSSSFVLVFRISWEASAI